jgi:hypothetical protein
MLDSVPARTSTTGSSGAASSGQKFYIEFGDGPTVAVSLAFNIVSGRMTDNIVHARLNCKFY